MTNIVSILARIYDKTLLFVSVDVMEAEESVGVEDGRQTFAICLGYDVESAEFIGVKLQSPDEGFVLQLGRKQSGYVDRQWLLQKHVVILRQGKAFF